MTETIDLIRAARNSLRVADQAERAALKTKDPAKREKWKRDAAKIRAQVAELFFVTSETMPIGEAQRQAA